MLSKSVYEKKYRIKKIYTLLDQDQVKAAAAAAPDLTNQLDNEDTVVKGDKVLIRWNLTGKIIKEKFGIPPSDKPVIITGFDLFKITNDKIVEMWQQFNLRLAMNILRVYF
jgi:predicted ester cyclase